MKRTVWRKLHNALARETGSRLSKADIEELFAAKDVASMVSILAYPSDPDSRGYKQVQTATEEA